MMEGHVPCHSDQAVVSLDLVRYTDFGYGRRGRKWPPGIRRTRKNHLRPPVDVPEGQR